MKTKTISVMCIALVLAFASIASAQARVQAGSDEDKALRKINALTSPDAQIPMLLDFEKQYPKSQALSEVYAMLVDIYMTKQDSAKIIEYGEKAIKADEKNVSALVAVSRAYAMKGEKLEVAVSYAQKAVDNVDKMKTQPAPSNYSDAEWKQLIKDNEDAAKGQLSYAKAVKQ
jgi:tetratricopeptide (TPR) repeat protein